MGYGWQGEKKLLVCAPAVVQKNITHHTCGDFQHMMIDREVSDRAMCSLSEGE